MSTPSLKKSEIEKSWFVVDASDFVLGRLSSRIAMVIRGKHKATYTPHMDCGDHVIVINAEKINVTGRKLANNKFFWHTGYVGGIKERTWGKILSGKRPEQLLHNAVKRMMPKESPLARQQLEKNLLIYSGSQHPHQAQKPQPLPL